MNEGQKFSQPTWMIGCGNMGQALVDGWRLADFDFTSLTIVRPSGTEVEGVRVVKDVAAAGSTPNLVILAIKPQKLDEVAAQVRPRLSAHTVIVSLLVGVELASLRERFPGVRTIVRALPNLPVAVRRGVVPLVAETEEKELQIAIARLFQPLGYAPWMVDEEKLAAAASVSGAGPAYVARFISALARAGEAQGLSAEMAMTIALETVFGTAWMAAGSGAAMDEIASRVASPKGTTEAGLEVLDRDDVLNDLVGVAIAAARRRGEELAESAKAS
jgi:pyrroline-5-carboxylate reductase